MQIHLGFRGGREAKVALRALPRSHGSASPKEDAGTGMAEEAGEESILDNLSPLAGDVSPMGSQEYDKWCADMDAAIAVDTQETLLRTVDFDEDAGSAPPKQVMALITNLEEARSNSEETPPDARIPAPQEPPAPPRAGIRPVEQLVAWNLDFGAQKRWLQKRS